MIDNKLNNDVDNSDLLNELTEAITEQEVKELGIDLSLGEKLKITSEEQAIFFLRRINELRDERDKVNMTCNNLIESYNSKVNDFRSKQLRSIDSTEAFFSNLLEDFARASLVNSKKKSLKLPFGTLSFKKSQPKYVYEDKQLLEYLKDKNLNEFIRIKEEVDKSNLKKNIVIDESGKPLLDNIEVEGLTILPSEETFTIK